jgi:flagellar biosynthesis/type III secretory pathway protein FliH
LDEAWLKGWKEGRKMGYEDGFEDGLEDGKEFLEDAKLQSGREGREEWYKLAQNIMKITLALRINVRGSSP